MFGLGLGQVWARFGLGLGWVRFGLGLEIWYESFQVHSRSAITALYSGMSGGAGTKPLLGSAKTVQCQGQVRFRLGLGQGQVWVRFGLGLGWVRLGLGLGQDQDQRLGMNHSRFSNHCTVAGQGVQGRSPCQDMRTLFSVRVRLGLGLGQVQVRFGLGLGWVRLGLGQDQRLGMNHSK